MSNALFKIINPIVKTLLRSPAHSLMSHNTVLLEFRGRKSGRQLSTPVSYVAKDHKVLCFTGKDNLWWRNLVDGDPIQLTLRGEARKGIPSVTTDPSDAMRNTLRDFLIAVPRDASHAGVSLDANGNPLEMDVAAACERLVLITITLQ